jgi:hypothetical protein
MQMLYQSDSYVVVRFDPESSTEGVSPGTGGFEIVDRLARREIYLRGAVAERFAHGVQALVQQGPSEERLDEFIAGFAGAAVQPLTLH